MEGDKMNYFGRSPFLGSRFDLALGKESKEDMMRTDIYEKDGVYHLEMDLPGFSKDNIQIDYDNGYITVEAKIEESNEEKGEYIHKEKFYGEYKRSFYLGDIKEEEIKAQYQDGILKLTLPKQVEQPNTKKQIQID